MDGAIARGCGKLLNREKIGQEFLLAYDESKKTLVVVSSDKVRVHLTLLWLHSLTPQFITAAIAHFRVR